MRIKYYITKINFIFGLLTFTLAGILILRVTQAKYNLGIWLIIAAVYIWFLLVSKSRTKEFSPSLYNPFGYIELHVFNKSNHDINSFLGMCSINILKAKNLKKNVVFCTWHFKRKSLEHVFGNAITIIKPSFFELAIGKIDMWYYKKKSKNPYIKAIIDTNLLSGKTLKYINSKANVLGG
ncbi:MAG: hypothetical protein Q8920_04245 [Bacillota bacterium]|nr:hypothetical protein [Bacillota bacterium]